MESNEKVETPDVEEHPEQPENNIYQRSDMIDFQKGLYELIVKHAKVIPSSSIVGVMVASIVDHIVQIHLTEVLSEKNRLKHIESILKNPELVKQVVILWLNVIRTFDNQTKQKLKELFDLFEKEEADDAVAISIAKEYKEGKRTTVDQETLDRTLDVDSSCGPDEFEGDDERMED